MLLSIFLALIGMYLIPRGLSFLADILGHAYLGAYLTLAVIYAKIADLASLLIALLMANEAMRTDEKKRGINIMLYYIFFTVILLGVVSVFVPQSLNMIVFGDILDISLFKLLLLLSYIVVWIYIAIKYRKEILLSIINKEFSMSVYNKVNVKEFWFVFFSLLILMHAISAFGILLTAAITLLPYLSSSRYTKSLKKNAFISILFSTISYIIAFYLSLNYDISISVSFATISLTIYLLSYTIMFFYKKIKK